MAEVVVSFVFANSLAPWPPSVGRSEIEGGLACGQVDAMRRLYLRAGGPAIRERLLALSALEHSSCYLLLEGLMALRNLVAEIRVYEITETGGAFGSWRADF
jgi:hypothetical protein